MPFVQTCTERESTARLGSTKGKLCKFGSGAYGLSVDPNAIRLPEDCTSSRRTSAAPITDIFGSTFATIRLVWCLLLLKTGIAVPSTRTIAEEPIQEFHFISENLVCTDFRAGGSNLERHNFPADEAIRDYLYHENDKDFGSELPGKLKRKFFRASGIFTIAAALFSPVFFDLYEIHAFAVEALFSFDYQDLSVDEYHLSGTMASSANPAPGGGIPLHEFRREVPPGWGPGIPDYPLRLFFERLKLWYQVYDGEDTMVGPLVAGRLQGKAQRLGLTLRLPRPDGGVDIGGDALARLTVDEVRDPNDPTVILQRHIPSGIQALCNALKDAFGVSDQELVSRSIEDFFEYRRGKLSFQEYSIERDCKLEEASTRAGLQINDVAKFYLFFRGSGLPAKFIEDIKLQLQGDLRLFREARALALRLISRKDDIGAGNDSYYEDYGYDDPDELHAWYADDWDWEAAEWDQPWDASAWYEEGWSWVPDYDSYLSEPDDESSWPPEGTSDEANQDPEAEHPAYHGEVPSPSHSSDQAAESKGGKGSSWSKGKGFGKPFSSDGYGGGYGKKGKSRGKKGAGKGKWAQKGKGKGYRKGRGYGSGGYFGYQKTLHKSFDTEKPFETPPRRTVHFQLDRDDDEPILPTARARQGGDEDGPQETGESQAVPALPEKKLAFNFASSIFSTETYHTILGTKRRGLLVDPGAASGLVGSETLRDLLEHCPRDKMDAVRWDHSKTTNVSGISGSADTTLGEVEVPLILAGAEATYKADVLGGEGSLCPALLSNPALRRQRAAILTNWFSNGDGAMVILTSEGAPHFVRILLTDSGHYLLPTDEANLVDAKAQKDAQVKLSCWTREIVSRWNDVRPEIRHCFLQQPISHQERERYHNHYKQDEDETNATPSSQTTSTTSGSRDDSRQDLDVHDETNATPSSRTTSTTSGSFVNMSVTPSPQSMTTSSVTPSPQSTDSSSYLSTSRTAVKPFLARPVVQSREDTWEFDETGQYLVRWHRIPRRVLFTPNASRDCPVASELLRDERRTQIAPNKDLSFLWTGKTVFRVRKAEKEPVVTSEEQAAFATESYDLPEKDFPPYSGDTFPDHWDEARVAKAKSYYKAIPEEFYSRSGRRPITPRNAQTWFNKATSGSRQLRFQCWEWFSGSGRLSLVLLLTNLAVGFPVDYRYGWDIGYGPHQALLRQFQEAFSPDHLMAAPNCGPWSIATAGRDPGKRQADRNSELPNLEFLSEACLWQHNEGRGFTVEQPLSSAMFADSPMSRLLEHEGISKQRFDQCMLGAVDEHGRPVRKSTAFYSNRRWRSVLKRCGGHKGQAHGALQGKWAGLNRTAIAAVYPRRLCHQISQDIHYFLRRVDRSQCRAWPRKLWYVHGLYYSCERCQLGRSAPPGCEHTLVPGECRYGQPSMRGQGRPATARPTRGDMEDPSAPWKMIARNGDYSGITLEVDATLELQPEFRVYLKAALTELLKSCISIFQEATGVDYDHWLDDPVLLRVFQDVFDPYLQVLGVMCSLRPWNLKVPEPYLSTSCAPLRVLIRGGVRSWRVHALEDMRLMSANQLKAKVDESDWHVTVFGYRRDDPDVDRAGAPASSSAQPAAPLHPAEKRKDGEGASSASSSAAPLRHLEPRPPQQPLDDAEAAAQAEEFDSVRPEGEEQPKTLKPLFDFKKVYKRLQSGIIESDPHTAKRLLLGLHERFYHCPITDFKNMLLRAGLPSSVLPLAEEAVMSCSICRKYVRLPNRPQTKVGAHAGIFNHRVQLDLFQYKEVWIMLVICEATRYKAATPVGGRSQAELLSKLCDCWIYHFGAPHQLVMDQESSLMSHEAGHEMERFVIERVPKGTTSGEAAKQHTGTGLVERHVGLMRLTMAKLEAEMDRQGIKMTVHELARESAVAHNQTLNYGGATPSMAVYGALPRPLYQEDNTEIAAVAGALQTDITPFERALRIRQMALSMVQQAVAEDRTARANRTRPHQLEAGALVPGVSRVDIYREVQGDVGWRGPAELLKLDRDEGTATVSYQGRPYLMGLRHIRPHVAGVFLSFDQTQQDAFKYLKGITEQLSPYKVTTIGWVMEMKDDLTMWRRASTSSLSYTDTWNKIVELGKGLSHHNVGGAMIGQSVRNLRPPRGTAGVLVMWKAGSDDYSCHEHTNDNPVTFKKVTAKAIDDLAFIYIYYYVHISYEPRKDMKVLPSEGATEEHQPMDAEARPTEQPASDGPAASTGPDDSMDVSPAANSVNDMEIEEDMDDGSELKRKGPETRTVVMGPESKRTKLDAVMDVIGREQVNSSGQHNLVQMFWASRHRQIIPLDFPMSWLEKDNLSMMALWDDHLGRCLSWHSSRTLDDFKLDFHTNHYEHLFTWPGKNNTDLFADLATGHVYKVDDETDLIQENEVYDIWPQVEQADASEVSQFVETKSFKKMHRSALTSDVVVIDARWVRKWKRMADGSRKVKSRLCARGCFDSQKEALSTRSTTATRLSQRILMSTSATQDFDVESWDISGAFLKGLTFEQIRELLRSRGISAPLRKVALVVPLNVWRHLAACDSSFQVPEDRIADYVLMCLKPVYGLNDAPLAWQLCLHQHFEASGGTASLMDENLFYWFKPGPDKGLLALATTHVDDVGAGAKAKWLNEQYDKLCAKFGKVTKQQLPFHHCGVLYSRTADGYSMTQDDFCAKLKQVPLPSRKDEAPLEPSELTSFRSALGGLLWLTATRIDLIADVCLLQSKVTQAKVLHLKQVNAVIKRAQDEIGHGLGLHYRKLKPPLKLACVHDSSAAGNVRHYAQEGVLVLLMEDRLTSRKDEYERILEDHETKLLSGKAHLLWGHGAKAKRISYSTSHAETLAAISGLEASSLVTVRLAELLYMKEKPTVTSLLKAQEAGLRDLPVDDFTDCRDFYELASGDKSITQDKGQRLYILAFREARLHGRVRWLVLTPTESMTADGLTKSMVAPPLMELLSSGTVNFYNQGNHRMTLRRLPRLQHVSEEHLDLTDKAYGLHLGFFGSGYFSSGDYYELYVYLLDNTDLFDYKYRRWLWTTTATTPATTSATTPATTYEDLAEAAMDVDTACLDSNDNDRYEHETYKLEIRRLRREVEHLTNLRENAYNTIRRLEERLQACERSSPFGRDLYVIFTCSFGDGHKSAQQAVEDFLQAAGFVVEAVDTTHDPRFEDSLQRRLSSQSLKSGILRD
ncbi:hypothetical protein AK812_SmicGene15471 [Symbiodinium microadriaticum]|uniref:Integrase catalytic domain-containing protein n=1 Tax=Symbiodinium microadriaticum TaxID=2951 RepID=A0A1Q9E2Y3_SYMMI|nr:hypothetical protein AK812_SmicGene15471 [Symbiodinium microadriaticum]